MITKEAIEAATEELLRHGEFGTSMEASRRYAGVAAKAAITAAFAAMPGPAVKVACPCTTFEQDEECPVGYPSMLCSACGGTGLAPVETVYALAAEMLKVAEQVDELEDPFAAWETIELLKSQQRAIPPANNVRIAELELAIAGALKSLDGSPDYHHEGMGCGLEDRSITDRYEAMEHGWEQAMERVYSENIAWAKDELSAALERT